MTQETNQYDYEAFVEEATGSLAEVKKYKIISYPFDRYDVKVKVTPNNEFVEIVEIALNKNFLTQKQKISLKGFHDVEKFYIEQ